MLVVRIRGRRSHLDGVRLARSAGEPLGARLALRASPTETGSERATVVGPTRPRSRDPTGTSDPRNLRRGCLTALQPRIDQEAARGSAGNTLPVFGMTLPAPRPQVIMTIFCTVSPSET
ncbi:hypothetical protein FRACA_2610007 [Frankia canadensis]|uniref:Uncharacterized protein n=1 Tax=Frankia canadensis TaxID=1836972 RepID=A0A2I2KSH7_9ACTN|nr:hypothetical protein FRACA_2610007 [Frankia canadensis]SOU55911.1 hypothetical protein FRACA_2610007 [Frankia canadensis]